MNKPNDQQSEAVNAKENKAPQNQVAKSSANPTSNGKKGSISAVNKNLLIAYLAVAIAVIGAGTSIAFTFWKTQSYNDQITTQHNSFSKQLDKQQQQFQQWVKQINEQQTSLTNQLANEQNKIKQLDNLLTTLQASQQNLLAQVSQTTTDASKTWMLFEAKQLLKQAFIRLRVADINGASKLLEDVNNTIKQRGDLSQTASQINQAIANALLKLQQVEQVDRANIYSQLAAIQDRITQLESKKPVFQAQQEPLGDEVSRWQKLSNTLSGYIKVDFNANSKVLPLLTAQGMGQLKMTLSLAIEKAQWAALNGEAAIYTAELERTNQLLSQYFEANTTEVKALIAKINELKNSTVIVKVPDISDTLLLVNNYLDSQINYHNAANQLGGENK